MAFKRAMPVLRPILRLFRVDTNAIDETLSEVDALAQEIEVLASLPDRFNDLLSARGWIVYDLMNADLLREAVLLAETGDLDAAEARLVEYYDQETVAWKLRAMYGLEAFRPRMPLAEKALADYSQGRYHACVPVVLALMDGLVSDLHEKQRGRARGFFAEEADLEAWDSVAGHSKGLMALSSLLRTPRQKLTTEPQGIPYRHGILHGKDLGYDNQMVAAKAWAALFAVRDWAFKAEAGKLDVQPPEPRPKWRDIVRQMRQNEEVKARLARWKPRSIQIGKDVPSAGSPEAFESGSPERALAEFLSYWQSRNYGYMATYVSTLKGLKTKTAPKRIRDAYDSKRLRSFALTSISDEAPAVSQIAVKLALEEAGAEAERGVTFRLINEDERGGAAVRGQTDTRWTIFNWDIL
jgi:hypothetical protein